MALQFFDVDVELLLQLCQTVFLIPGWLLGASFREDRIDVRVFGFDEGWGPVIGSERVDIFSDLI